MGRPWVVVNYSVTVVASTMRSRTAAGDRTDEHDRRENELSVNEGFRILSAYTLSDGTKIWIITEADRSATTILLPEEY